jgi:FKBP-type peptidyl-prolyl cis-trans isomerase 2
MKIISSRAVADLFFEIHWSSEFAEHTDAYLAQSVNFWRDILPPPLERKLSGKRQGDRVSVTLTGDEVFPDDGANGPCQLARGQFDPARINRPDMAPLPGRFYPKGLLRDVPGIFSANVDPFRVVGVSDGIVTVDLGHPLAGRPLKLSATVGSVSHKDKERGGGIHDWLETICQGVGMQAPWHGNPTEFFVDGAMERLDETADSLFYQTPRLVQHLDDVAVDCVRQLYGRFVKNDMRVLDLLASWQSHLPQQSTPSRVSGIGLNEQELRENPVLTDFQVQDLNEQPAIAFPDNYFDVALCTASIEYLSNPDAVFAEVARTLRPGGVFVVTFSNRWFEPKAISVWKDIHEFERMGLVLEYFRRSGQFTSLATTSVRGLPRPRTDRYYGRIRHADPFYGVWGRKLSEHRGPSV